MHSRLVPDIVVLRLASGKGTQLRSSCLSVSSLATTEPADAAALLQAASSGVFGVSELSLLQRLLNESEGRSVREMVLAAEEEGLSAEALAALAASRAASSAAAASRRRGLEARAAERDYQALLQSSKGAAAPTPLREVAAQASMGGGLFLVLLSATLMGYYLGVQLYGKGSTGVSVSPRSHRVENLFALLSLLTLLGLLLPRNHLQAWVCALICAVGTLVLEGGLMVLRMSRADAYAQAERVARDAVQSKEVAAPVDPLQGCEGGTISGESLKEKAE